MQNQQVHYCSLSGNSLGMLCGAVGADPKTHLCSQSQLLYLTPQWMRGVPSISELCWGSHTGLQFGRECERKLSLKPRTKEEFCWLEKYGDGKPCCFLQICWEVSASTVLEMTREGSQGSCGLSLLYCPQNARVPLKRPVRTGMARCARLSGEVHLC